VFYILSFLFGASIGSFVQVVVSRLHVAPIVKARSKCLSCGEALRAYDLIPFFSYLFLRGKCRYCKTPYGLESLLIEVIYGISFVLLYITIISGQPNLFHMLSYFLYYTVLFAVLGIIALYDRKHTYIPVLFLFMYCFLTLLMLFVRHMFEPTSLTLLAPIIIALPFLLLFIVTKGRGVGFGDVLLFLGVGAFFGIEQGVAVLMLSIWMGAIVGSMLYLIDKKKVNGKTQLPFVPFIVVAFLIVLFTDIDIFSIANLFATWYH
jgi:leader peptidase (prepilin peptidase) / N-methyltransferase